MFFNGANPPGAIVTYACRRGPPQK